MFKQVLKIALVLVFCSVLMTSCEMMTSKPETHDMFNVSYAGEVKKVSTIASEDTGKPWPGDLTAKEGNSFYLIKLNVENVYNESWNFGNIDLIGDVFELQLKNGHVYDDPEWAYLYMSSFQPGEEKSSYLAFEIPDTENLAGATLTIEIVYGMYVGQKDINTIILPADLQITE